MTQNDIQQIAKIFDERLEKKLEEKFDEKLKPIHHELSKDGKMLQEQSKILKSHSKLLRALKRDQDTMLNLLDREQMDQRKRITRIETYLSIPS